MLEFGLRTSLPVILQAEAAECGLACLAMIATYHGHQRDIASFRRQHDTGLQGLSLRGLISIADKIGFSSRPLRLELDALKNLKLPCILHWDMNHFVVLERVRGKRLTVVDPARGRQVILIEKASSHFTGVALELMPSSRFEKLKDVKRVRIRDLWRRMTGLKRSLVQLLLLTGLLQVFALVAPLFNQLVVDGAIVNGDLNFLTVLAFGFGLLVLIQIAVDVIRDYVVLYFSNSMTFQMRVNLFRHLIRLPADFFLKRHIGDIQSRFGSLGPIEHLLTTTLISAVLDGIMAITTVIVIFLYSWQLSIIVLIILLFNLTGTLIIFPMMRSRTEQEIKAGATEQTTFLEIIRGLTTIKTFGRENEREAVWANALAGEINQGIRLAKIGIWSGSGQGLLFGLGNIAILAVGARMVINSDFTLGMLLAFLSYQNQFIQKAQALIENLFEYRMLGLHLERLSDIVHAESEGEDPESLETAGPILGRIELEKVSYRYGSTEPYVLKDLDLTVDPGQYVIIQGPSGAGKSTLLKIMMGLIQPTSGVVRIDDQPLNAFGLRRFRRQIGVVSQDDTLFSGTLAENISFFDPEINHDLVSHCADVAMINQDILAMPMRYETLVGDMGSSLSGGQRQRILLARALYNDPKILILDEGLANLDDASMRLIIEKIGKLNITRIIVTHDEHPTLINEYRYYWLEGGKLADKTELKRQGEPFNREQDAAVSV